MTRIDPRVAALMASEGISRQAAYERIRRREDSEYVSRERAVSQRWKAEHREENRARDREYVRRLDVRGTCTSCGDPMGIGYDVDGTCSACQTAAKEEKWAELERLWAAGTKFIDVAAAMGWTKGHLSGEFARMREAGRDLPYRYRNTKRQRAAA